MSVFVDQSVEILAPGTPDVLAVSGAASAATLLPGAPLQQGRFITFCCIEQAVYIKFGDSSVAAPDETATSGSGRCWIVPAAQERSYYIPANVTHFRVKAAGSGNLRYYVSSP